MSVETLQWLARLHGLTAWAATVALIACAWLFVASSARQRAARAARAAAATSIALIIVAAGLGLALHDPYRSRLRQRLFVEAPALGWLFERKQSAAFAAVLFGVCGLAALAYLARNADAPGARDAARGAAVAWIASACLALAASVASVAVARHAHF